MDAKKENKMAYFLGGTTIGIAASFLIGKIIRSTSKVQTETFGRTTTNNEKIIKFSENDDNINNFYHLNNVHSNYAHSQSTLKDENIENSATNNINDLTLKKKHNQTKLKDYYHNITKSHDISIEDNTEIKHLNKECSNKLNNIDIISPQKQNYSTEIKHLNKECSNKLNNIDIISPQKQNYFNDM